MVDLSCFIHLLVDVFLGKIARAILPIATHFSVVRSVICLSSVTLCVNCLTDLHAICHSFCRVQ